MNKKTKCNLIIVAILLVLLPVSQFAILSCSSNKKTQQIADNTNLRIDQDRIFTPVIINAADTLDMLFNTGWPRNSLFRLESVAEKFEYDMLGHPVIETELDSAYTCRLIFDTGSAGMLILNKDFAEKNGLINRFFPTESMTSGWNFKRDIPCMTVKSPVSLSIGNKRISYSEYRIVDRRALNFLTADGIFSIPNEDTHMWEIDCKNKLLSAYDYPVFPWLGVSLQLDVVGNQFVIRDFPFQFRHGNEYVHPQADLVMDTGSSASLIYLYSEPDSAMRAALSDETTGKYVCPQKNGIIPTLYLLHECGLLNRKLWIEHRKLLREWHISGEREMIVAGMDFLKSFNLRLYPAEHRIELIPIEYTSLQEDISRQKGNEKFRFRAFQSREGHAVVDFVKEGSFWQNFGIKEGDVILDIDGHRLFDLHRSYFEEAVPIIHHSFTIIRNQDTLFIRTGNSFNQ